MHQVNDKVIYKDSWELGTAKVHGVILEKREEGQYLISTMFGDKLVAEDQIIWNADKSIDQNQ